MNKNGKRCEVCDKPLYGNDINYHGLCKKCYYKKKDELIERQFSYGFKELKGTDKQKEWAYDIREEFILFYRGCKNLIKVNEKYIEYTEKAKTLINSITEASVWIEKYKNIKTIKQVEDIINTL